MKGEFIVDFVMPSGYISRRSAVSMAPPSPSQSLPEWKLRPVCGCSTASLAPEVLGLPLSQAFQALFCSGFLYKKYPYLWMFRSELQSPNQPTHVQF